MSQSHIVIVDDEETVRETLREFLIDEGYQVTAVADGEAAIQALKDEPVQIVLTDLRLPGMGGLEILERAAQVNAQIACIVMTGYGTVESAVKAMKAGAYDFITKPIQFDAASVVIKKALEFQKLRQENLLLRKTVKEKYRLEHLIGTSDVMRELHEFVEKVADSDSTILIQGESGTGKELVARMLHFNSLRRDRPLVPVNCGAIPENLLESELFGHEKGAFTGALNARMGRFELAHGGTLFLDEVGEMSPPLQVKLLRAIQERAFERVGGTKTVRVDVRIIAATNIDLEVAVKERRFREDLYYRLNVIPLTIPPLRERRSDIPLLVDHFIRQFSQTKQTSIREVEAAAMNCLMHYSWPGNIRELENLVERLVILKRSGTITVSELPEKILNSQPTPAPVPSRSQGPAQEPDVFNGTGIHLVKELERYENRLIAEALRKTNGVTSRAAQLLHLNRTTLVEKLKRKGLDSKVQGELYV
ncbi:MAG: sigma-54-dependent Fis family transcriptional regulator [Nitrospirae bacterium]|nr:sigma-54-dependent Fis family transcriptional regulator [Nitrospirota bacterium]